MSVVRGRARRPGRTEDGSGTVYAALIAVLSTTVALVALQVIALARAQHQVTGAADLAALAATRAEVDGGDPCRAARRTADANAARLRDCTMQRAVATVVVERRVSVWGLGLDLRRTARAAPSDYVPAEEGP